jgi:hypothetical protein
MRREGTTCRTVLSFRLIFASDLRSPASYRLARNSLTLAHLQLPRPAALEVDYGEPLGLCTETSPGVFARAFTKLNVTLDCSAAWAHA